MINSAMPRGVVIPELAYADVEEAADWLCDRFGFTLRFRFGDHRAQLNIGDGGAMVVTKSANSSNHDDRHAVMVRIDDVNRHHAHAVARDVRVLNAPQDFPYGERQYSAVDLGGHHWTFTQSIADFDPRSFGAVVGTLG